MDEELLKNKIQAAIEAGKVKMRPRWHFLLQAALLVIGAILATLAGVYLISFIIFTLRQTGASQIPGFGYKGLGVFLTSLPWLLILLSLAFIIILEILVRRYAFSYRRPLLYSTIGIIAFVLVGGFAVAGTSFHRHLFDRAWNDDLPLGRDFYRGFGVRQHNQGNFEAGKVLEKTMNGFKISDPRGQTVEVKTTADTVFSTGNDINVNDNIAVLGSRDADGIITATDIRKIQNFPPPPQFHRERNF